MRDVLAHDSRRVRLLALLGVAAALVLVRADASQAALTISSSAVAGERAGGASSAGSAACSSAVGPCFFLAVRVIGSGRIQSSQGYGGERLICPPQDGWGCVLPLSINDAWFNWPFGAGVEPQITLTAVAEGSGQFSGWTNCPRPPSGPAQTQCVVAHSDLEEENYQVCVTATFTLAGDTGPCAEATEPPVGDPVSVTKAGAGQGYVTSSPLGINCGNVQSGAHVCTRVFPQTSTVTLNAHLVPGTESTWAGWSGFPCNGSQTATTCQFTMPFGTDTNPPPKVNITATFNGAPPPPPPPAILNAVILQKPAKTTRKRTARFVWAAKRGTSFVNPFKSQCRLNKQVWKACSPPKTYRNLRAGRSHTFRVRVKDARRNVWDKTPAVWTWRIRR